MVDPLQVLCYVKTVELLIRASRRRRQILLDMLPTAMSQEIDCALLQQSCGSLTWRRQIYCKGLVNHCIRKVIELFADKDYEQTEIYLTSLNVEEISEESLVSRRYLRFLLLKLHHFYRWRDESTASEIRAQFIKLTTFSFSTRKDLLQFLHYSPLK
jgi:hypothetical protein